MTGQFGRYSDPIEIAEEDGMNDYNHIMKISDVLCSDLASTVYDWIYLDKPYLITLNDKLPSEVNLAASIFKYGDHHIWDDRKDLTKTILNQEKSIGRGSNRKLKKYLLGLGVNDRPADLFSNALNAAMASEKSEIVSKMYSKSHT